VAESLRGRHDRENPRRGGNKVKKRENKVPPLKHVVAIGGGTGLPALLEAIKPSGDGKDSFGLTAIVTVMDDGGSSGRLRRDLGTLPPGDIRNCLAALSEAPEMLKALLQYRFRQGELKGHSLGNLLIAGLAEITGDFASAVKNMHDILAIKGRIFPSTTDNVQLVAELTDGSMVRGEAAITRSGYPIQRLHLDPDGCRALPEACDALAEADLVLMGPGSLFTSILPHLLVPELARTLTESRAFKVYVCNLTTQPGETDGFTASMHLDALRSHVPGLSMDAILCNSAPFPAALLKSYERFNAEPVRVDDERLAASGCRLIHTDLLQTDLYARHDPAKLRRAVFGLFQSALEVA
jgi:uncharacterized cofD-like protein